MLSDINIRHLDARQAFGMTANTSIIDSRCRTPPKTLQVQVIFIKISSNVKSCHIKTLKKLSYFRAEVFLKKICTMQNNFS